ncbi:MAG: filamentous hemagglutinin N-terminal domain-containing protein [Leptolyngbya sp. SIO3F4]|nr:filamentous hemagglutinin N-terminal domain-containing protein [Leptolyngbya sp. SIO3F4]
MSCTSVFWPLAAGALPVADTTVGTQITPFDPDTSIIEGGTAVEQNLFHSFESFNIEPGKRVFFFGPDGINHIFSRVTGGETSQIDGVLGTFGSDADLFLINPDGVVFGPEASLAVQGSFIATTADGVQLGESGQFSATMPTTDNLLAVDPSAFFFPSVGQPENIKIDQSTLLVPAGEALVLLGGNITIDNGSLVSDGGRLEMGAIATADVVTFSPIDYALSIPETAQRRDIRLTNDTSVSFFNVASDQATSIRIYANNLDISNDTFFTTAINTNLDLSDRQTGAIQINATGNVTLSDDVIIGSVIFGNGQTGDLEITAENLAISNSLISSVIGGEGKSGDVVINVNDQLTIVNTDSAADIRSTIQAVIGPEGIGESGDLIISANSIDVRNGFLSVGVLGSGESGDIVVDAQGQVNLTNGLISSSIGPGSVKTGGGNITVSANTFELFENGAITTDTDGIGDAGDIKLNIKDRIVISDNDIRNTIISSEVESSGVGNGGDIEIVANSLEVLNGGVLSTNTDGMGDAGNIKLTIQDRIVISGDDLEGTLIAGGVATNGIGNGGDIEIVANSLELLDTGQINSLTGGLGDAGDIKLNIRERIVISGNDRESSIITSAVIFNGVGEGGDIEIFTPTLEVLNAGQITASTAGVGDAGDIFIDASDFIIDGTREVGDDAFPSAIFSLVREGGEGNGGNVEIATSRLEITNGATVNASTFSEGLAGNIVINADDSIRLNRGDIIAESLSDSPAGNITITADQLSIENLSLVSTATRSSVDGGNIKLTLGSFLVLRDRSDVRAQAGISGDGGDGGNINIVTPFIVAIPSEDSDIQANAFEGDGGRVNITARGVFGIEPRPELTPLSDITASSESGVSGIVAVNALDTSFIQNNLNELSEQFINSNDLIDNACVARGYGSDGTFTLTGRNLADAPNHSTGIIYSTGTVQPLLNQPDDLVTGWQLEDNIQEPSGIYQLADGRLIMSQECS